MDISLRLARHADAAALSLISTATFLETYHASMPFQDIAKHCLTGLSEAFYANWLADPAITLWLAEHREMQNPVAFLALTPPDLPEIETTRHDLEVRRIYALSGVQGSGLGRKMMRAAMDEARSQGKHRLLLGVSKKNAKAIAFYQKTGFEIIGARQIRFGDSYYQDHVFGQNLQAYSPKR